MGDRIDETSDEDLEVFGTEEDRRKAREEFDRFREILRYIHMIQDDAAFARALASHIVATRAACDFAADALIRLRGAGEFPEIVRDGVQEITVDVL